MDATRVPAHLSGFRTIFAAFHHFRPAAARRILPDAVDQRRPIAAFELVERRPLHLLGALFLSPLPPRLVTPFIRSFRWSRLLRAYAVPAVPFCTGWDGLATVLRIYALAELRALAAGLKPNDYTWKIGRDGRWPLRVTYLIGYPPRA